MDFVWLVIWLIITLVVGWGKYKLAEGSGCIISLIGIPLGAVFGIFIHTTWYYPNTIGAYYFSGLLMFVPLGAIIGYIIFLMIPKEKKNEYSEYEAKRKEKPKRG